MAMVDGVQQSHWTTLDDLLFKWTVSKCSAVGRNHTTQRLEFPPPWNLKYNYVGGAVEWWWRLRLVTWDLRIAQRLLSLAVCSRGMRFLPWRNIWLAALRSQTRTYIHQDTKTSLMEHNHELFHIIGCDLIHSTVVASLSIVGLIDCSTRSWWSPRRTIRYDLLPCLAYCELNQAATFRCFILLIPQPLCNDGFQKRDDWAERTQVKQHERHR
jgi:hypothetical protein